MSFEHERIRLTATPTDQTLDICRRETFVDAQNNKRNDDKNKQIKWKWFYEVI